MIKKISVILCVLLLSSCITEKKRAKICASCPVVTETVTNEVTRITPFDTTLFLSTLGKDIIFDTDAEDCCILVNQLTEQMAAGNGTISTKANGVKSSIYKTKGKVVFRCEADSLKAVIKGLRTEINTNKSKVITKTITVPCMIDHVKWYHGYSIYWFWISMAILLGMFGPKLLKLFL